MVYAAMDLHRNRTQVVLMDDDGDEVINRSVGNDSAELQSLLASLEAGTPVAFEASYGWPWLADVAEGYGLDIHLAHPARCKAIASARLKNDKLDARMLAHLLRSDLLAEAWLPSQHTRDLRTLLRHRVRLVRLRTSFTNRIHAVIADVGVPKPASVRTSSGRSFLDDLELRPIPRAVVDDSLALIDALQSAIGRVEREIRALAAPDPRVHALTELHGIGVFSAMTLISEIDDITRFATARKLCAWAGMVPSMRNSDTTVRHGHITKEGPAAVRWVLIQAAHKAKMRPPFDHSFAAIARRRGKNIATVAIARKLLCRCFHILKDVAETVSVPGELDS